MVKILTDSEQVLKRWKMHTENMYSQPEDQSDRRRFLHRRTEDEPRSPRGNEEIEK